MFPATGYRTYPLDEGLAWWAHHILSTRVLAEATFSKDKDGALGALMNLWSAVKDWERITRSAAAGILMAQHTILAGELISCMAAGGKSSCVDTAVNALTENVKATGKLFPVDPQGFAALFGPHTELAGAYITDLAKGDMVQFEKHWDEALLNGQLLQGFTDRTFLR